MVKLPYEKDFSKSKYPQNLNQFKWIMDSLGFVKKKLITSFQNASLEKLRVIGHALFFYVNKNAKIEKVTPKLVINYKPLNKSL